MTDKIQILQINADNFKKGGMSQVIWRLMENLSDDIEFSFFTYRNDVSEDILSELDTYGAKRFFVKKVSSNKYINFAMRYHQAESVIKRKKFDFIHINADNMIGTFIYILAAKKCNCKIVLQCHTTSFQTNNRLSIKFRTIVCSVLYYFLKDYIDVKLAVSTSAAHFFYGKDIGDVHILLNGFAPEKYIYNEEKRVYLRNKMGVGDKIVVGHIGRFCYAKNHSFLLRVFEETIKKNEEMELWLIGDGPLEDEIKLQVQKMGLGNKVRFLGTTQDIQMYLSAFDVFLFPSRYEGFGLALVEAQANDLPTIVSDVIPEEAEFSDKVCKLSLNDSLTEWSNLLLENIKYNERRDMTAEINNAGLNIYETSKKYLAYLRQNCNKGIGV